ncbi:beta-carotene isomerase D27, chloroplastic [Tanacetum coccineum]
MSTLVPLPFNSLFQKPQLQITNNHRIFRLSAQSPETIQKTADAISRVEYTPGLFDNVFLNLFRNKMVQEVGWDSEKPGYDGLIDVANRLMVARTNSETKEAAVRILRSLFPPFLLELYKILISPIAQGKLAAVMM